MGLFELFTQADRYLGSSLPTGFSDLFYGLSSLDRNLISKLSRGINNHGFIVDTVTRERLVFQYNVPSRESGGANYASHEVLARSIPQLHYRGGQERVLELPLTFTMQERSREDILRSVRFLQSLAYPDYHSSDQLDVSPHPVVVIQGKLYTQDLWLVRDFRVQWGEAMDPISQLPSEVRVYLSLVEIRKRGKSQSEVIRL